MLLFSGFVAYGWPDGDLFAVSLKAPFRTDQNPEARLFQDVDVVVVGVSHGPARGVLLCLLAVRRVNVPAVTVGQLLPTVEG